MRYLLDDSQAKALDQYTIEAFGMQSLILMERAAYEVTACIERLHVEKRRVFVMSGMGNNGADGLAVARLLFRAGYDVCVAAVGNPQKATAEWQYQRSLVEKLGIEVLEAAEDIWVPSDCGVYVDALFGIGLKREIAGIFKIAVERFMQAASASKGVVVAVDICSGIDAGTGAVLGAAVRADVTVTFGYGKVGQFLYPGAGYSGQVQTADIGLCRWNEAGLGDPVRTVTDTDVRQMLGERDPGGNKGSFGKVLVVAGAYGMAGAAYFAAKAAYRVGAGLVRIWTAYENRPILQQKLPEAVLVTADFADSEAKLLASLADVQAVVIGPGLSQNAEAGKLLELILANRGHRPLVIDADGLNLLAAKGCPKLDDHVILTPHPGELARLLGCSVPEIRRMGLKEASFRLWQMTGAISICKDARTVVRISDQELYINTTGNDGMATGGSGDVLAGMIGGLLAQGISVRDAAAAGVYLHGRAGDLAASQMGRHGMLASDLLEAAALSIRQIVSPRGLGEEYEIV